MRRLNLRRMITAALLFAIVLVNFSDWRTAWATIATHRATVSTVVDQMAGHISAGGLFPARTVAEPASDLTRLLEWAETHGAGESGLP